MGKVEGGFFFFAMAELYLRGERLRGRAALVIGWCRPLERSGFGERKPRRLRAAEQADAGASAATTARWGSGRPGCSMFGALLGFGWCFCGLPVRLTRTVADTVAALSLGILPARLRGMDLTSSGGILPARYLSPLNCGTDRRSAIGRRRLLSQPKTEDAEDVTLDQQGMEEKAKKKENRRITDGLEHYLGWKSLEFP